MEIRYVHKILENKPYGKRPLGSPGHRWEEKIEMYFKRNRVREFGLDSSDSV
jgi:hypothetical protein